MPELIRAIHLTVKMVVFGGLGPHEMSPFSEGFSWVAEAFFSCPTWSMSPPIRLSWVVLLVHYPMMCPGDFRSGVGPQ